MVYLTRERVRDGIRERLCRACAEWWLLEQFVKAKNCFKGRRPICKACHYERRKRYRK